MTHDLVREATKKALNLAKKRGILISFDPNLRESLWCSLELAKEQVAYGLQYCDILKISDNELQWFTGEEDYDKGIWLLKERYQIPMILLSLGKEGSRAYYKNLRVEFLAFLQKNTIDTTGAGDTFLGSCLHYILEKRLQNWAEKDLGEMPTVEEVQALLEK